MRCDSHRDRRERNLNDNLTVSGIGMRGARKGPLPPERATMRPLKWA